MLIALIASALLLGVTAQAQSSPSSSETSHAEGRLITLYDRGEKSVFLTQAATIGEALKEQGIELDVRDAVEPSVAEELVAPDYRVNIYRARPVIVVDGITRTKIITPYQTAQRIAKDAGITLYVEDKATMSRSFDLVGDGAGLVLTIQRATHFTFDLYGKKSEVRTHGRTVGDMLKEKNVLIGADDRVSVPQTSPMYNGMEIRVWREGKQTITDEQAIGFGVEFVYDADRPVGYRAIQTPGKPGVLMVTYEVEIKDGKELSRKEIARLETRHPATQQLTIGIKGLENGLSPSRGALFSTDSNGVVHRETYYDLNMNVVARSCGQGGVYSVRFDGMKIDREGYILVAANYARYPKCSIVETSAGPGRVYDTGGFVVRHPDGFDLATDWSRRDGI